MTPQHGCIWVPGCIASTREPPRRWAIHSSPSCWLSPPGWCSPEDSPALAHDRPGDRWPRSLHRGPLRPCHTVVTRGPGWRRVQARRDRHACGLRGIFPHEAGSRPIENAGRRTPPRPGTRIRETLRSDLRFGESAPYHAATARTDTCLRSIAKARTRSYRSRRDMTGRREGCADRE